jgi:uncharacterized membrane protein (DUF2068 family)
VKQRDRIAVLIGILKLGKAASLIALAVLLLAVPKSHLVEAGVSLGFTPGAGLVRRAIGRVLGMSEKELVLIAGAMFLYAGLFATEGVALVAGWGWAHGFAIGVTGSFIPIEIFELVRHASVVRAIVLASNIAIVIYLAVRLAQRRRRHRLVPAPA